MISPGRLWWLLRRDLKRGWEAAYHDYKTKPLISQWSWPFWKEAPTSTPIHVLTGKNDWQLCLWALASFFHFSEHTWKVVIHDDGTLPMEARTELRRLFPQCRLIDRSDADAVMEQILVLHPRCMDYRRSHPLALKIFDFPIFCQTERFIALDSDVLFFRFPPEIMAWVKSGAQECWFNEDVGEGSLVSSEQAWSELQVPLWPRVNSGLGLITKSALDLDFCERVLGQTDILQGHVWRIEQTLYALCASRHGKGGLLPKTYEVSLGRHASPQAIARHYVGAVRDHFYDEGLKRLKPIVLAKEED